MKEGVLLYLVRDGQVLLGRKLKKVGIGKLNTYGGNIEMGEAPILAAIRELEEESRGDREVGILVDPPDVEKVAEMLFHNTKKDGTQFDFLVHVFITRRWRGEIVSTDDIANPEWYLTNNLPLSELMPADPYWLPRALSGEKIIGEARNGPDFAYLIGKVKVDAITSFFD